MLSVRTIAVVISLAAHASLAYALTHHSNEARMDAFNTGAGEDTFTVEQGVALDGVSALGDEAQTMELAEIAPVETVKPVDEVKPLEELSGAVTSLDSNIDETVVKTDEPPPPKPEEPKPEQLAALEPQPAQVAVETKESSSVKQLASNAEAFGVYLGKINETVQRAKVAPRSRAAGLVVMNFTIGTDGRLLSSAVAKSSGSKVLDDAALAAIDKAAPFPPIPPEVSEKPIALTQPFRFSVR